MANERNEDKSGKEVVIPAEASLHEKIGLWLEADEWHYSEDAENRWYYLNVSAEYANLRVIVGSDESEDWQSISVFCVYPVRAPEARRSAVAELMARINGITRTGGLEVSFSDGEIRQKCTVDLVEAHMNDATFQKLLNRTIRAADTPLLPILSVAFGETSPATAFEQMRAAIDRKHEAVTLQ